MASADYELVLMLDPEAPDERRDQIAAEARGRIEASGSLKADRVWGTRKLAYEIRRRIEADYRFFRFESENPLLEELDHNLKITDGVLRFRIFKIDPEAPVIDPPPPVPLAAAASRGPGGRRGGQGARPPRDEDPPHQQPSEAPVAAAEPAEAAEPASPEGSGGDSPGPRG